MASKLQVEFEFMQVTGSGVLAIHKVHFVLLLDIDFSQWERNKGAFTSDIRNRLDSNFVNVRVWSARRNNAREANPIRRGDDATTRATWQASTQCQTQLNEATALHQQCLASGPLTPLQCECQLFFCQCSAGRIEASQSISRWETGASELEGSGIGLQRRVKDAR